VLLDRTRHDVSLDIPSQMMEIESALLRRSRGSKSILGTAFGDGITNIPVLAGELPGNEATSFGGGGLIEKFGVALLGKCLLDLHDLCSRLFNVHVDVAHPEKVKK